MFASQQARYRGFAAALFVVCFMPATVGAQVAACTPTQTVSAEADADGVYTTTLVCADTSAAEGAADYRQLHYNHGAAYGANPADRNTALANNNANNHLVLTIGRGVIFTADRYADHRLLPYGDGAILLTEAGAKTVTVEDGAVINIERTPTYWLATDPNRPDPPAAGYQSAWYPTWLKAHDSLTGIGAYSDTSDGDGADIAIRHDGVINIGFRIVGTYASSPYNIVTSGGRAIDVQVKDTGAAGDARSDIDVVIEMGATGVIRHVDGTHGLSGIYAENFAEDGDIRIDLAEGSLIDVSKGGGYGVLAYVSTHANNNGARTGDIIVNAAGTIRAAVRNRAQTLQQGMGILATGGFTNGRVRVTSSGTIETLQNTAIDARAWRSSQMHRDDPDTAELEGHIVDIAGGTVETRGTTALYASTGSINSHMTVRVAEGATLRARALTQEDYDNGALVQERFKHDGNRYIVTGTSRYYGWRRVDVTQTTESGASVTVKRLEPIIAAIVVRDFSSAANAEGIRDQVFVDGTVETIGGGETVIGDVTYVDPAIWLESGGLVVVGANGRVSADSGLAISGGCSPDYRKVDFNNIDSPVDCDTVDPRTLEVRVAGTVEGDIRVLDEGLLTLDVKAGGTVAGTVHDPVDLATVVGSIGRVLYSSGGAVTVGATGRLTGVEASDRTEALGSEGGALRLTVNDKGMVTGDVHARGADGRLTLDVKAGGTVAGTAHDPVDLATVVGSIGRVLYSSGGAVTVGATGRLTGVEVGGKTEALGSEAGALRLTVNDKGTVTGDVQARGEDGRLTLDVKAGGTLAGTAHDPVGLATVVGSIGRVLYSSGGAVTVGATGRLTGVEAGGRTEALGSESGNLRLTVNDKGMVTGDVQARGEDGRLTLDVKRGGTVAGTVHDPVDLATVVGSVGRVLYSSGGAVTVGATGRLTGVEVGDRTEALGSEGGALSLTVNDKGTVTGDVQARGDDGRLTLDVKQGGTVTGTVHDPASPLTVAGNVGRILYSSGGTVTVASTGALTGVEVGGGTEALRSASGELDVTVAGRVAGDLRPPRGGALMLSVPEGGTLAGTAHDPAGPLTVAGSVGRLLYSDGGTVTVARTGRLTGVDGVAIRSETGDLDVTVAGAAMGDILGLGEGDHTVTVSRGGTVTGTIRLAASTVRVDGAAGCVRLDKGGIVTVGATGRIVCADGAGVRSETGDLTATVAGAVTGDVVALGRGEHRVSVAAGARVTGVVRTAAAGSAVAVAGTVGKVRLDNGGAVTLEATGRIPGINGVSVESPSAVPAVTIVASANESLSDAAERIGGAIVAPGVETSLTFRREGETGSLTAGRLGTARAASDGAYDIGLVTEKGALRVVRGLAPRARVYEALPSALLGMERPASHAERAAAPRASNGAWARIDASQGSWEAASSANAGLEYDRRGFSFQAGVDAVLGEEARGGVSVHVRRATAEVSQGGDVEARGAGVGLSATWSAGPVYVDGQATATLYDLDLTSTLRGALKDDARAHGLSAALEAGRAVPVGRATVTPRARVAYSSVSLSDFDDSVGARVSLDRGRSLTGRAGALAELVFGEGRVFGSLDVEHEFEAETRMSVAGTSLAAAGEETRYLAGVGAERGWEDGRFMLRGALGYAATGGGETHGYGGNASLSVRF